MGNNKMKLVELRNPKGGLLVVNFQYVSFFCGLEGNKTLIGFIDQEETMTADVSYEYLAKKLRNWSDDEKILDVT